MTSPTRRPSTGIYRVRIAVPARLRPTTKRLFGCKVELAENLKTRDPAEAKRLAPAAVGRLQAKLAEAEAAARGDRPPPVSDRTIQAYAGRWYNERVAIEGDSPGKAVDWDLQRDLLSDQLCDADEVTGERAVMLSRRDRSEAAAVLVDHGHHGADAATVDRMATALFWMHWRFVDLMERRAQGDWSPDENPRTFATLPTAPAAAEAAGPAPGAGRPMDDLLRTYALDRGWKIDAKPVPRNYYDRLRTMERMASFMGHRDAARVTKDDAVRWKQDMQRRGLHTSTVRNDLAEMSAIWRSALRNGLLPAGVNPFADIAPPKATKRAREARAFTDAEALAVLLAARQAKGWARWLSWVLALTGARLAEITQSERADVAQVDGVWTIRLHDEGEDRSLKNVDSRRIVPLHPALIAEGFLDYMRRLPPGPLFPDIKPDSFGKRAGTASKRLARWVRLEGKVADPTISPAHSWRHWWVWSAQRSGMPAGILSAITGHSAKLDASAGYGPGIGSLTVLLADHMARVRLPAGLDAPSSDRPAPVQTGAQQSGALSGPA